MKSTKDLTNSCNKAKSDNIDDNIQIDHKALADLAGTLDPRGIKIADVVLLGYPLMRDMPDDVRRNDLELYESITTPDGPAMTWSMFAIK